MRAPTVDQIKSAAKTNNLEILYEWMDGADIQARNYADEWVDLSNNPSFKYPPHRYRVKPKVTYWRAWIDVNGKRCLYDQDEPIDWDVVSPSILVKDFEITEGGEG